MKTEISVVNMVTRELRNIFEPFNGIRASAMAVAKPQLSFWSESTNSTRRADGFPDLKKIPYGVFSNRKCVVFLASLNLDTCIPCKQACCLHIKEESPAWKLPRDIMHYW